MASQKANKSKKSELQQLLKDMELNTVDFADVGSRAFGAVNYLVVAHKDGSKSDTPVVGCFETLEKAKEDVTRMVSDDIEDEIYWDYTILEVVVTAAHKASFEVPVAPKVTYTKVT